ncbi:hypothetical protein CN435_22160 [Priestia megaterium]|nr:hypothetical protein CN435_22160 [Priestia megaterium]
MCFSFYQSIKNVRKSEGTNVFLLMFLVISICGGLLLTNVFIYSPIIGWLLAGFCLIRTLWQLSPLQLRFFIYYIACFNLLET